MLDFQRELLNRFLTAAAITKADGFENTAAAILAVAEDLYKDITGRTTGSNNEAVSALQGKTSERVLSLSAH